MIKESPIVASSALGSSSPSDSGRDDQEPSSLRGADDVWPRGVLLDIDGTLLASNGAHARAWLEALVGEGIALPYESVRRQIGKGGEKLLWELVKIDPESLLGQTIARHRERIFKSRYLPGLTGFPGTRELLERMRASGLGLHVATSSGSTEVNELLTAAGVTDLLEGIVSIDDSARSKPGADIVRAAVARSGLPKSDLIMLGDTPYDVRAATDAGIPTVAFRSGGWTDRDLRGAIAIYDGPSDLLDRWESSPFAAPRTLSKDETARGETPVRRRA